MKNLSVLVVDDEPGICSGVKRILERFTVSYPFMDEDRGFDVYESYTGEEAIGFIQQSPPDIVLLDNKLPGIQGTEVLDYINKNNRDIIVMIITSYASLELAVKATNQGAYDFIPKPFTPQELKSSMENVTKNIFLRSMTKKLNKEGKEVRFQFLSVLSHELKSPLNAVEGYLQIMQERQAGNNLSDYDQVIDRSLQRIKGMRTLIMDLLDLTRIQSDEKDKQYKQVNLKEVAQGAIESINPYAIQKDVTVELHMDKEVEVYGDPNDMEIVMNNLVSNAVKYNYHGGGVDINIDGDMQGVHIQVRDTGIGMKKEDTARLFKEFVRIKNDQTKNITGSGLGLSIVKKVIDLYDGHIDVESEPEKGSTFTVFLPITKYKSETTTS
ncbi:MAG: hybrid sensor histidine kinase/response regulator [Bacteroidales bacterium]|nr:hybrid sensor histidine kinase/response regulator [Bacteroidales bacterium]